MTITHTELVEITVNWQCKAYTGQDANNASVSAVEQPATLVSGAALKRVKKLNVFEPCTHQLGDRSFYTLKENDILMVKEDWKRLGRKD